MSIEEIANERDALLRQRDLLVRYVAAWRSLRQSVLEPAAHMKAWSDVERAHAAINAHPLLKQLIDEHVATKPSKRRKPLPEGGVSVAEWATVESARSWLMNFAGCSGTDTDIYRAAARRAHPDAGGSNELMAKVNRARDFIEKGRA